MVAVLLRLRFRVLANTLTRNTFQLVAVVLSGMFAAMLLAVGLGVLLIASTAPPAATQVVVVVGGAALVLGWLVVPLLFDGVDRTLDPVKLARFPLRLGTLMVAMFLVGLTWMPGIVTLALSLGTAIAWREHPVSAVAAIITGLVGTTMCVAGSRLTTTVAGTLLSGRGAARFGIAALAVIVAVAPIVSATIGGSAPGRSDVSATLTAVVGVLGWTPFGAVWSIPGRLAMGDPLGAAGAAAIALGAVALVLALWRLALGAGSRMRDDSPSVAGRGGGRLGPLGWMPSSPTGAVAARSLVYWFRDARQARQLILLAVLPALMLLWWQSLHLDWIAIAIGPVVAVLLPFSAFAGLSYDGTAFAAELSAGVRGFHDRLGRAVALLIIVVPVTVIVQLSVASLVGLFDELPALLGLSLGVGLVAVGVVSVSSARIVVPVARARRNPFSAQPGSATVSIGASYLVAIATIVLALPIVAAGVAALAGGSHLLGWLALVVGLVAGSGVALGGLVLGGRVLDASGPAVLARLRLIRD
ncbi:MAG TPA: transporter [Diaminobutyricibacter sp.]